jgi:hypothetical protein
LEAPSIITSFTSITLVVVALVAAVEGVGVVFRFQEGESYGAVRAIDPLTGEKKWDFKMPLYAESWDFDNRVGPSIRGQHG